MFNDATARPALERAASDPKSMVRIYAILVMRMLGALSSWRHRRAHGR
jgi:hypothetical protein